MAEHGGATSPEPRKDAAPESSSHAGDGNLAVNTGEVLSSKRDMIQEDQAHWQHTSDCVQSDAFLHHYNRYNNWYNNSHEIVRHQSRPFVKPQALTTVTCAFGNLMVPKLVRLLSDPSLNVRQKALLWIVEVAATPMGRVQAVKEGMLEALAKLFTEEDIFLKQQIALAAANFAGMQQACTRMSRLGYTKWLLEMVSSPDAKLKELSLSALLNASFYETVRSELVRGRQTIRYLMGVLKDNSCEECSSLVLKIFLKCISGGIDKLAVSKLLDADAVPICVNFVKGSNEDLQASSLYLLCGLSARNSKSQAEELSAMKILLDLLEKDNIRLKTAATAALMSLTINIDAKKSFVAGNGVPQIVPLIDTSSKILSLNSLQVTTNVAEYPLGRSQLQVAIKTVRHILETSHSDIQKRFAKATLQQLLFKHRPYN